MRALVVIDSLATGGAETLTCGFARAAAERDDLDLKLVLLFPVYDEAWRLEGTGVEISWLGMRGKRDIPAGAARLRREIAGYRPDVIHTHLFPADLVTALAVRRASCETSTVLTEHAESNRRRGIPGLRRLDRWIYAHFDTIVCVSPRVEQALHRWLSVTRGRTAVVTNAVEVPAEPWRPDAEFDSDLLFVGRLVPQKGLDVLIDALALLAEGGRRPTLSVIGQGKGLAGYRRRARDRGVEGQLRFVGRQAGTADAMRRARALVMPSRFEGLSMVLLEAMALGMPVIATAVSGAGEVIEDGASGTLVAPEDAPALARAIEKVLGDPEEAARLGRRAREAVESEHSMQRHVRRIHALYESAVGEPVELVR